MKNYTKCSNVFAALLLITSSWAQAAGLVWGEGNWGDSDWNSDHTQPSTLTLVAQPQATQLGQVVQGSPTVRVNTAEGGGVAGVTVIVSLQGGTFSGGTLSAATSPEGEATFANLSIGQAGTYTLLFSVADTEISVTSAQFTVLEPPPPTPPPETEPTPVPTPDEEVEGILDDIVIPDNENESISDDAVGKIGEAADAGRELAQDLLDNIEEADDDDVVSALRAIGNVSAVTGAAAGNTTSSGNTVGAAATASSGSTAINSFSALLSALDGSANSEEEPRELTVEQKLVVQDAAVKAVTSAVNILAALPADSETRKTVLKDLGSVVTSSVNLGIPLTSEQADSLLAATDQASGNDTGLEEQLEASIAIKPKNKALVSRATLSDTLGGEITEAELDTFLAELSAAINPADVRVGDVNGEEALDAGFSDAIGDGSGAVNFDADTGLITFSFGGADQVEQPLAELLTLYSAISSPISNIPGRVVSANVVPSGFPDGVNLRSDGSAVITSSRMAFVVVPASADPVNFFADLRALGLVVSVAEDGNVVIQDGNLHFTGTFDFLGLNQDGEPQPVTSFTLPAGIDESDLDYRFEILYRSGARQTIHPFIAEDSFLQSARGRGVTVSIDRNTGVITADGLRLRPSYFIEPMNQEESQYWTDNQDSFELAFRIVDVNNDGVVDVQVMSGQGVQVAYGLVE